MRTQIVKLAQVVVGLAAAAAVSAGPAGAAQSYGYAHHPVAHRAHYRVASSDVTVRKSAAPVAATPDVFGGPLPIVTAPIYIAGAFVSMPFRALEVVFPANANDPRVVIGAPAHFIGQVAQFPFSTVNGAFGARRNDYTY